MHSVGLPPQQFNKPPPVNRMGPSIRGKNECQSGPVELETRWPRGQIRWPRANDPVLTACVNDRLVFEIS